MADPFAEVAALTPRDDQEHARYARRCLDAARVPLVVGHLVPLDLEAVCRVFPPLTVRTREDGSVREVPWSQVAASTSPGSAVPALRRAAHEMEQRGIDVIPRIGHVDEATVARIASVIAASTRDDVPCVYRFWHGRGLAGPTDLVYDGPLSAVTRLFVHRGGAPWFEPPDTLWARDGSWAFAMHTDAVACYVAGARTLVDALLVEPGLEADLVAASTPVDDWTAPEDSG